MTSIPDNPKDQFLFFIDNPIVAGEPGGKALIEGFLALVAPVVGGGSASSAMAALFDSESSFASAPVEGQPAGDTDRGGGHGGGDAGAGFGLALGLLGAFAKADLDI
jgi:hypothetical protein